MDAVRVAAEKGYEMSVHVGRVDQGWVLVGLMVFILTLVPASVALAEVPPPANDDFAAANTAATAGLTSTPGEMNSREINGSTASATREEVGGASEPIVDDANNLGGRGETVWYRFTAPANGTFVVSCNTRKAAYNQVTQLAAYTGDSVDSLTRVAQARYVCEDSRASLAFEARKGVAYHVQVDRTDWYGVTENAETFALQYSWGVAPDNDDFAASGLFAIAETGSVRYATGEVGEPDYARAASVWFRWTAPNDVRATFETCRASGTGYGNDFNTKLGVYTGDAVGSLTTVAQNDNACPDGNGGNTASRVTFDAEADTTYRIQVGNSSGGVSGGGYYALRLTTEGDEVAPAAPTGLRISADTDTGASDADSITNDTSPAITGRAEKSSMVPVYADNLGDDRNKKQWLGIAKTDGDGVFTFDTDGALAPGAYNVSAYAYDAADNGSRFSAARRIVIDTKAPTVTKFGPQCSRVDSLCAKPTTSVTAEFSETMDAATLDTDTLQLFEKIGDSEYEAVTPASVGYEEVKKKVNGKVKTFYRATLDPSGTLETGSFYRAEVLTGAQDVAGNPLAASKSWVFGVAAR